MSSIDLRWSLDVDAGSIVSDLLRGIEISNVSGALLFVAPDLDTKHVCQQFDELFPFAGCTMKHSICTGDSKLLPHETSQTALLIVFYTDATLASGLVSSFPKTTQNLFCFSTTEASGRDPLKYINAIGGIAASDIDNTGAAVWCNHIYSTSQAVGMTMPELSVTVDIAHGWKKINDVEYAVTDIRDNRLYGLDGKPATDVLRGISADPQICTLYPLFSVQQSKFVSVLAVDEEAQCLVLSQPLSQMDRITIGTSSRGDVLAATDNMATLSFTGKVNNQPELALCISCSSRDWLFSEDQAAEFRLIEPLAAGSKVAIIYLDGEFVPDNGKTKHLNHTLVMSTFYAEDSDKLSDF